MYASSLTHGTLISFILWFLAFAVPLHADEDGAISVEKVQEQEGKNATEATYAVVVANASLPDANATFSDHHPGFLHGFVEGLSVIVVSEIGDKTFFIAAIMAMTSNKLTIFLAAVSALALMTVLSALLGFVVTSFIPRKYTYYACSAIMFLFGLKMLWEAWRMKSDETSSIEQEVHDELEKRKSVEDSTRNGSSNRRDDAEAGSHPAGTGEAVTGLTEQERTSEEQELERPSQQLDLDVKRVRIQEKSLFGKRCYKIVRTFMNCFTMTFLAEWGDRSQLATIVMAGVNDVAGVCVGGVLGHACCTGAAVVAGALLAKRISARAVTVVGAVIFLGFAIASLFMEPEWSKEDAIKIDGANGLT